MASRRESGALASNFEDFDRKIWPVRLQCPPAAS